MRLCPALLTMAIALAASVSVAKPRIVSREEWGARPPKCQYEPIGNITAITIHHTATSNDYVDAVEVIKSIQKYHMDERGWCDIGYHFLVDRDGNIYEGRPLSALGAHVAGHNQGNVGIAVLGDFNEREPNAKEIDALVTLVSWLVEEYRIPLGNVKGHRDYAATECPGEHLYEKLENIRRRVGSRVYSFGDGFGAAAWMGVYSDLWPSDRGLWERKVDEALKALKDAGFDAVFFLAKDPWGYVYYNSSAFPRSPKYSWDPLAYVVKKAKEYGLSVHVYVNALSEGETRPDQLLETHPDWAVRCEGKAVGWVDPSAEDYVQMLVKMVEEIVTKYDVDGVQLDRIRLPSGACELPLTAREFEDLYGRRPDPRSEEWRAFVASKVTEIVKAVRNAVKAKKPSAKVSAAVLPDYLSAYTVYGQDWAEWLKSGTVDFVALMSYTSLSAKLVEYGKRAVEASGWTRPVYLGIGVYLDSLDPQGVYDQVKAAAGVNGVNGIFAFNVDTLVRDRGKLEAVAGALREVKAQPPAERRAQRSPLYSLLTPLGAAAAALALVLLWRRARNRSRAAAGAGV